MLEYSSIYASDHAHINKPYDLFREYSYLNRMQVVHPLMVRNHFCSVGGHSSPLVLQFLEILSIKTVNTISGNMERQEEKYNY